MSEPQVKHKATWWVAGGLVVCAVLAMLRVGLPLYRRKCTVDAVLRVGTIAIREPRTPDWVRRWVLRGATSPCDQFDVIATYPRGQNGALLSRTDTRELLIKIQELDEVTSVSLTYSDIDDENLSLLGALPNLEYLNLSETTVTSAGMKHLARLSNLTYLDLSFTRVGDDGLTHLTTLTKLQVLKLDGTRVSNSGIEALAKLPNLDELSVSNTGVTDGGLEELRKTHPNLTATDD